ncbi:hypothetical protein [Taylorella asinigenitalis]|uniref:hypothetical protein n=1 Tax=Taylorella asinigenitalis TaxID=84590 RepID=UPI0011E5CA2E|nr:hypothetical protein [Taylorella asinigenitalis]
MFAPTLISVVSPDVVPDPVYEMVIVVFPEPASFSTLVVIPFAPMKSYSGTVPEPPVPPFLMSSSSFLT